MKSDAQHLMVQAWKQQLDTARGLIEAMSDGATKLREMHMKQLLELQAQWGRANAEECAAYWRAFGELADNACKHWLDTTQQFYKLPAITAEREAGKRAAA